MRLIAVLLMLASLLALAAIITAEADPTLTTDDWRAARAFNADCEGHFGEKKRRVDGKLIFDLECKL